MMGYDSIDRNGHMGDWSVLRWWREEIRGKKREGGGSRDS